MDRMLYVAMSGAKEARNARIGYRSTTRSKWCTSSRLPSFE